MYLPKHFEETRVDVLHELIKAQPLGAIVVVTDAGLDANHIPFEIDPEPAPFGTLRGHVARANPLAKHASDADALVIFQDAGAYISPGWYVSKQEHGKVVPTWNYVVVHAHGPLRVIDDTEWLRAFVTKLTNHHERSFADPWKVTDAPADYVESMLKGIVGIEVPISRLVGKFKVSQNRPAQDRASAAERLLREGGADRAAMAERIRQASRD
jgi:transcriptional regulator